MSKNPDHFHFDIPIPIIVLAYFFNPPIGVVLTVLRAISIPNARQKVNDAARKAEAKFEELKYKTKDEYQDSYQYAAEPKGKQKKKKKGPSAGVVLSMISCILFFILGVIMLLGVLTGSASLGDFLWNTIFYVFPFMCISGGSYLTALFFKGKDARYNRIRAIIGDKDSFSLVKIAAASKESLKKVRRDVQHLIDKGEFGDTAYIDLSTNNFMRHPDAQPDYVEGFDYRSVYDKDIFGKAESESVKKGQKTEKNEPDAEKDKTDQSEKTVSDKDNFRAIILEIRRLNDEIHDFAVSERIYRIEEHTQHIFDYVIDHPEAMPQIRTFMNYYLPTTLKLLESYSRIERVGVAGENMKKSKENIENILDMLVVGFEQQVDQLFKNESIDISSDISVLETMMQKDGLSGKSDFQMNLESFANEIDFGGVAAQQAPAQDDKSDPSPQTE